MVADHPWIMAGAMAALVVHLAWAGLIAGTGTVAVAVAGLGGPRYWRLAAAIARLPGPILFAVAGLEVTATVTLVGARVAHPLLVQTGGFWAGLLLPLVAGLALLGLFRSLLEGDRWRSIRTVVGLAGIGLLLTSCFLLCSGSGVLLQPEMWPTAEPPYRFLATWGGTGRFAEFTCLALATSGVAIMALGSRQPVHAEAVFARRFGRRLALVFLLALPPALLFTHFNLPAISLSRGGWAIAAAVLAVAGAAAWLVARASDEPRPGRSRALLAAPIVLFGLLAASDHLARENALDEAVLAGVVAAPPPPLLVAAAPAGKLAAGKAVFDRVCHLCHRFDTKLIGPPFDLVVPKYRKDPAALKAFIRSPVKKNPAFPAMPKPAVNEIEIDAVAAYLLEQAKP